MDSRLKSFPKELSSRAQEIFPPGMISAIWKGYLNPHPHTIRVNTLKSTDEKIRNFLSRSTISFESEKTIPHCYYLKNLSLKKLQNLEIYQNGEIYLQNFSSQIPAHVLNPKPGERVLDLCASPGSKTSQMAAMMNNDGTIIAVEPDKIRFERLKYNLEHLACTIVEPILQRGESFCRQHQNENLFDKVLVDAPCSGDGTFYVHNKASYAHWSVDFVNNIAKKQLALLNSAIKMTKPHGKILYSTCSISPEENELVIQKSLEENPQIEILDIRKNFRLPMLKNSLQEWQGQNFSLAINKASRIYPAEKYEGFFLCLMNVNN